MNTTTSSYREPSCLVVEKILADGNQSSEKAKDEDDDVVMMSESSVMHSILPPQSAADIFYAMMNGESMEDPSATTTTDVDESSTMMTSPIPVSPLLSPNYDPNDTHNDHEEGMMSFLSTTRPSDVETASSGCNQVSKKHRRKTHNSSNERPYQVPAAATGRCSYAPPSIITIDENNECETTDGVDPFMSSSPLEEEDNRNTRRTTKGRHRKKKVSTSIFYVLASKVRMEHELRDKAEKFKECVDVRDRAKNLVIFKQCFVGSEAVDAMLYTNLASTREEAVELGRTLARDLRLFRHVRGRHLFKDEDLYYHYTNNKGKRDSTCSSTASSCDDSSLWGGSTSCRSNYAESERLAQMAEAFRQCVQIGDRRFRLKTYKNCFVGREAVDMLVSTRLCSSRKDAVEFGRTLMRELELFQHVTGDHSFCDGFLFYRFKEDGPANHRLLPMPLATL